MANVLLTDYGVVIDDGDIVGHSFVVETVKKNTLIRELSAAGIFYNESSFVRLKLRTFISGYALHVLKAAGIKLNTITVNFDDVSGSAEPEDEESDAPVPLNNFPSYYVERDLVKIDMGEHRMSLLSLPSYVRKSAKPKNQEILEKKIRIYSKAVENLGSPLHLEPMLEDDDDDDGLTGGRLTDSAKEAQFDAHRAEQAELRNRAVNVLDYMEENFFSNQEEVEVIPFDEAQERFKDAIVEVNGEEVAILSHESLMREFNEFIKKI